MNNLDPLIAEALFAKSNVSGLVGSGKLSAIYQDVASNQATPYRYGVFFRQSSGVPEYSFGPTEVMQTGLWTFKAVIDESAQTSVSPQKHAETMLATWKTALGATLTITGAVVEWMQWAGDIPPYQERLNDRWVFHRGFQLLIKTRYA